VRRALLGAGAGAAIAAVIGLAFLGAHDTIVALAVLVAIAAATLTGAELIVRARRRGRAGSLPRQFAVAVALAFVPLLAALIVLGLLMFVSGDDAALVSAIVVCAGAVGAAAAVRLSGTIIEDIESLRDGLTAVGTGARELPGRIADGDELGELARSAEAMVARLAAEEHARDQSEAARRGLIAAASHDLRTPLTSLRLLAQAIDDGVVDEDTRREYVSRMLTHIGALSGLVDDLFELARLEAGDIRWSLERVAMGELVTETIAALSVHADLKGIGVSAQLPDESVSARANPEKLQRVLFNLIQNAIRHTPADGSIVVHVQPVVDGVEVEVADTGDGFALLDRDRVFEAFYRADTARTTEGTGLGLAVARAIVEAHGGQIWIPGSDTGARVRFRLQAA
jgi:signal transduction histidine kinase